MSATNDKVYYQSGNVLITSTRAEIAGQTFVMPNIASVSMVEVSPKNGGAIRLLLIGVGFAICGLSFGNATSLFTLIGLVGVASGFLWLMSLKTQYAVSLTSGGGEIRAIQSADSQEIGQIADALKQAVIDGRVQKVESVSSSQIMRSSDDHAEKLKSLKGLLDAGVLSPQEYETKKAEILSRM